MPPVTPRRREGAARRFHRFAARVVEPPPNLADMASPGDPTELVVLLAEDGTPCGTAAKAAVHHADTPLHLAFSCWVLDGDGRTLLTRRAAVKRTWPGVWTNTFCGHPAPGEAVDDAVHRRAADELGATLRAVTPVLPTFRYRAVMADGTVENEVCPVYTARLAGGPEPNPAEVAEIAWIPIAELRADAAARPGRYSPWLLEQLPLLA